MKTFSVCTDSANAQDQAAFFELDFFRIKRMITTVAIATTPTILKMMGSVNGVVAGGAVGSLLSLLSGVMLCASSSSMEMLSTVLVSYSRSPRAISTAILGAMSVASFSADWICSKTASSHPSSSALFRNFSASSALVEISFLRERADKVCLI